MLSRRVCSIFCLGLLTLVAGQRHSLCQVLKRSQMTYVLTNSQRQLLRNQGYNFSEDPFNGIYKFVANPQDGSLFVVATKALSLTGTAPYSLGIQKTYEFNAPVPPFPSFEANQPPNGILSAVSVSLDKCGRLWVLDNVLPKLFAPGPIHNVQLFAISMAEKRIIYNYQFPKKLTTGSVTGSVTKLTIDDYHGCNKIRAIVADTVENCLYIFDYKTQSSWRVDSSTFQNVPEYSNFQYKNNTLYFPVGVYSLGLSPPMGRTRTRYLFYNAYAANTIYAVPLSILYRKNLWTNGFSLWRPYSRFASTGGTFIRRKDQSQRQYTFIDVETYFKAVGSSASLIGSYCDMDSDKGVYYCALPKERAISAWPVDKPFSAMRVVAQNDELFQNIAIIRLVKNLQGETELVMSTSPIIQLFLGLIFPDPSNYAVYSCKTSELYKGDSVNCTSNIFPNCQ